MAFHTVGRKRRHRQSIADSDRRRSSAQRKPPLGSLVGETVRRGDWEGRQGRKRKPGKHKRQTIEELASRIQEQLSAEFS